MVIPNWHVRADVDIVTPNVGGELDVDLRLRSWVANAEHIPIRPGDWDAATSTLTTERELVDQADRASDTPEQFEDLLADAQAEHVEDDWSPLDLGVAGLVMVLNAAGFATTSSCRVHAGGRPFGEYPFVIATGDEQRIAALQPLARQAGAGMSEGPQGEGFGLYAPTIRVLMELAALIADARSTFEDLPETIGWDQDAYEELMD